MVGASGSSIHVSFIYRVIIRFHLKVDRQLSKITHGHRNYTACTEKATEQAGLQRRALDTVMQVQKNIHRGMAHQPSRSRIYKYAESNTTHRRYRFQRVVYLSHPCPKCNGLHKQSLKTLRSGAKWCRVHGVIREERQTIIREQAQSLGL